MRSFLVALGLLAALPVCAEGGGQWSVDVHSTTGTLGGHYRGTLNGEAFSMDLKNDLALASTGNKAGVGLEYQGPRFGLELSMDAQSYTGNNAVPEPVTVNGQSYGTGAQVASTVKTTTLVLNWTIRALTFEEGWFGVDLGVRDLVMNVSTVGSVTNASLTANGTPITVNGSGFPGTSASASYKGSLPLPMIGLSGGVYLFGGSVLGRAYYHLLEYSGASYTSVGADLRYFPVDWAGVRVFANAAKLKIPTGSLKNEVDIGLDQTASGVGVVFRF